MVNNGNYFTTELLRELTKDTWPKTAHMVVVDQLRDESCAREGNNYDDQCDRDHIQVMAGSIYCW